MAETNVVEIVPVVSRDDYERFVRLPYRLNRGDPAWRAPLLMERREALSAKHNPFFAHAEVQFWLARRGGRDVGRISAQIDRLLPKDEAGHSPGHFGLIAAEDDAEVFAALFAAAEAWLAARGCTQATGPFNLGINEEIGLLVDGFDTPPVVMMGHDPPYAAARIEALGYAKAKDVYAYIAEEMTPPPAVAKLLSRPPAKNMQLRTVDMKRFDAEVRTMVDIFNDGWSENWGFAPLTEAETVHLAKSLKLVLEPRLVWFLEIDGDPAAVAVCLPDINEAAGDLDGKLLPFGWAKLLWRLKVKRLRTVRLILMGVRKRYWSEVRGAAAPFLIINRLLQEGRKLGFGRMEISWVLEDNVRAVRICEALGADRYKTYRLFSRALEPRSQAA